MSALLRAAVPTACLICRFGFQPQVAGPKYRIPEQADADQGRGSRGAVSIVDFGLACIRGRVGKNDLLEENEVLCYLMHEIDDKMASATYEMTQNGAISSDFCQTRP